MAEVNWNALYTQFPGLQAALGNNQQAILQQGGPAANTTWPEMTAGQVPAWRGMQYWRDRAQPMMAGRPADAARAPYTPTPLPGYKTPTFQRPEPTRVGQTQFPRPQIDPSLMAPGTTLPGGGAPGIRMGMPQALPPQAAYGQATAAAAMGGMREPMPMQADAERAQMLRQVGAGAMGPQTPGRVGPEAGMQFAARPEIGVVDSGPMAARMQGYAAPMAAYNQMVGSPALQQGIDPMELARQRRLVEMLQQARG